MTAETKELLAECKLNIFTCTIKSKSMAANEFLTYQKFINLDDVKALSDLLKMHGIEVLFEDETATFDPGFAYNALNNEYRIKLKKTDFEKADELQLAVLSEQIESIDKDYYLFGFTDEELMEVIVERDKWSKYDFLLAQRILKDRGKEVNKDLLGTLNQQRIAELATPEKSQRIWVIVGYLIALLAGLFAFLIGWHLMTHKKTLPNGERVYSYISEDRKHGFRIIVIGIICFIVAVVRIVLLALE